MRKLLFLTLIFLSSVLASCNREAKDPFDVSIQIMSNPVIGGQDFTFRVYASHPFYIDTLRAGYNIPHWKGILQEPRDGYVTFTCKNPEVEETSRETLWMQLISYTTGEYKRISTDYVAYKAFSFEYSKYSAYVLDGSDFVVTVRSTEPKATVQAVESEFTFDDLKEGKTYVFESSDTPGDKFYYHTFTASGVKVEEYAQNRQFSLTLGNADGTLHEQRGFTYVKNTRFTATASVPSETEYSDLSRIVIPVSITSSRQAVTLSDYDCTLPGIRSVSMEGIGKGDRINLSRDGSLYKGTVNVALAGTFGGSRTGTLSVRFLDSEDPRSDLEKVGENFTIDFAVKEKGTSPTPGPEEGEINILVNGSANVPDPITMDIYDPDDVDESASVEISFSPSQSGTTDGGFIISQSNAGSDCGSVDLYVNGSRKPLPYEHSSAAGGTVVIRGSKPGEVALTIQSKKNEKITKTIKFFVRHRLALVLSGTFTREGFTTYDHWVGWMGLPESMKMYLCEYDGTLGLKDIAEDASVHPGELSDIVMQQYTKENVSLSASVKLLHKSYYTIDRERYYLCGENPDAVYEGISGHQYKYLSELYTTSRFNSPMDFGNITLNSSNAYNWSSATKWGLLWTLRLLDDNMKYVYKHMTVDCIDHAPEWEHFNIEAGSLNYDTSRHNVKYIVHIYKAPTSGEKPYWYNCDKAPAVIKVK